MKKHIIKIIKIIMTIISILIIGYVIMWGLIILTFNLEQKKPSEKRMKKEISAYLDKNLDDKYEIKNSDNIVRVSIYNLDSKKKYEDLIEWEIIHRS